MTGVEGVGILLMVQDRDEEAPGGFQSVTGTHMPDTA